jgi:hypothetical protein
MEDTTTTAGATRGVLRRRIVEERKDSAAPASSGTANPIYRSAVRIDTGGLRRSDLQRTERT